MKESINATAEFYLTPDKLNDYPGSTEIWSTMEAALKYANQLGVPQVVMVSETSYVVCGIPDTSAESGFVHVKTAESRLHCTVSNCRVLVGGKQLKVQSICLHAHLLSCCLGLWKSPPTREQQEQVPTPAVSGHESGTASSVARLATIGLNSTRRFPCNIPIDMINTARNADCRTFCAVDGGWPREFIPDEVNCRLCGSALGQPRCHPGSKGKAVLLTNINPFLSVDLRIRMCSNKDCRAMHQPDVYNCGNFNQLLSVLFREV